MSGKTCAVGICKNSGKCPNISFHRFPRDKKLRKIWILKCRREDQFNPDSSRICSVHFKPEEFERDFQGELLGSRLKAILKPNVIPTLNLKDGGVNITVSTRQKRMLDKNEKEMPGSVCSISSCDKAPNFEDAIEAKIQNRLPKLLKRDCIPSLNIKPEKNLNVNVGDSKKTRLERAAKRNQKEFLKRILEAEKEQDYEPENVKLKNKPDDMDESGMDMDQNDERGLVGDKIWRGGFLNSSLQRCKFYLQNYYKMRLKKS
ncbi:unnamed protein product [Nezara viridula]|uniref:THAP-type domain-containing protein n=1 Tax=Nezara viridula TaxID=85310 RepID=A0A9P0HS11_NEZVI|nr:unnamed protein product [Nezara viridula]